MLLAAAAKSCIAATVFLFSPNGATAQRPGIDPDIPYIPTPHEVVQRMLALAEVGPDDFVIDLGSGDGRILITAAKSRGARGFGVDIDPKLVQQANESAAKAGLGGKIDFRRQDLFETPLRQATVIALYLPPQVNFKLRPRLLKEPRPGTRIISHEFGMAGWLPDARENVRGVEIFFWIVPADVAGEWVLKTGALEAAIVLEQEFQELSGVSRIDGREQPLARATLRGDRIELALDLGGGNPAVLRGFVKGDTIEASADSPVLWHAVRLKPGARKRPGG